MIDQELLEPQDTEIHTIFIQRKKQKTILISKSREENKKKLVERTLNYLKDNQYEHIGFIFELVEEALNKKTQKELKQILEN